MTQRNNKTATIQSDGLWRQVVLGIILFLLTSLCIPPVIKYMAIPVGSITLVATILWRKQLRDHLSLVGIAALLLTAMTGLSTFYSPDRALALPEFSNLFVGFCVFLLVVILGGRHEGAKKEVASIFAVSTAATSLISIDLLSTRLILNGFLAVVGFVTKEYHKVNGLEAGVRMTSIYTASNVFAGIVGLGVLLSLGLALTAQTRNQRILSRTCLFLNSLAFVLTFSMGGTATIVVAFLVMLLLENRERRIPMAVLMVETLVLTLVMAVPIFATAFQGWLGIQPIPLLCAVLGSVLLCTVDQFAGRPMAQWLGGHSKIASAAVGGILALTVLFGVVAYNWTGDISLAPNESLRRSAYPSGGSYQLMVESDAPLSVTIESQNEADTLNHDSTILYAGDAHEASFQVPEDSLVVYFNFTAPEGAQMNSATLVGEEEIGLKLGYKLLPGFMANRLQGLWANENAIQRTAFFSDGLTMFAESPIIGRGSGAFEALFRGVQEYSYATRYVHNHYIQVMLETGLVGLALFLGLLGTAGLSLFRRRKVDGENGTMVVALLGALTFVTFHTMVEVVFSMGTYLVVAMGIFGLIVLFGGETLPIPQVGKKLPLSQGVTIATSLLLAVWVVLIGLNRLMPTVVQNSSQSAFLRNIKLASTLDPFDGDDFRYACIAIALSTGDEAMTEQATLYAEEMAPDETDPSNVQYLIRFYLQEENMDQVSLLLDRFMAYNPDDVGGWEMAFDLLWEHMDQIQNQEAFAAVVRDFYQSFLEYNASSEEELTLGAPTLFSLSKFVEGLDA